MDNEKAVIDQLHRDVALLLQQKKTDEEVIQLLIDRGTDRHYAETVLYNVQQDRWNKKGFRNTLLYGLGFLLMGLLLTYASYRFAVKGGLLYYLVFWGVIVAGISQIARAFILFRK